MPGTVAVPLHLISRAGGRLVGAAAHPEPPSFDRLNLTRAEAVRRVWHSMQQQAA
jgi:hypothetical protein